MNDKTKYRPYLEIIIISVWLIGMYIVVGGVIWSGTFFFGQFYDPTSIYNNPIIFTYAFVCLAFPGGSLMLTAFLIRYFFPYQETPTASDDKNISETCH